MKDKFMYRNVIISFSISICFASVNIQSKVEKMMQSLQEKYQVYSLEDMQRLSPRFQTNNRTLLSRDMDDIVGEWYVEQELIELYVTVGSDQSMPNMIQTTAMEEAEGSVTATSSNYETNLTYLLDPSIFGDAVGHFACDDGDETEWYSEEEDCNDACEAECYYDDDDGSVNEDETDGFIMNFNFTGLLMMVFGIPPDGVENPVLIVFTLDSTNTIVELVGMAFSENGLYGLIADSATVADSVSFDTLDYNITFTNLSLVDSTGSSALSLNGTIGPGMIDLVAGVATEIPFPGPEITGDGEVSEIYMTFNEDSTGMEIMIEENYYYEEMVDTTYFDWLATSDSVWLYYYSDDEEYDSLAASYEFNGDTLFAGPTVYPCEEEIYDTYEECITEGEMSLFLGELEDVQDLYLKSERVMLPTGSNVSIFLEDGIMPDEFKLYTAYPNPFNPVTTLRYDLPKDGMVNITIYDMMGRVVKTLINGQQTAGYKLIQWDATNDRNESVSAGLYLYTIQAGEFRQTKKMVLLK